ncbi:MT-A70 family methyltransferase [Mesorhizobium sp. M0174]
MRKGLSETDKRALSRELNFARRHMTTSQKQDVIADQLRDTPSISSRAIAGMLGVHHSTVEGVRKRLVDGGEISHHEEVEGKDGVRQPARKAIKTAFVPDRENVGEFLKGAKIIRAEKQKIAHTVRLAHMDMVRETGGASAPGKLMRQYAVGYADPPWKFGVRSEVTGREKSAENHYPTMTTDEIIALFRELDPFTENAVFFCWATNPMLLDALRLLEALGFTYVHHWVWDKEVAGTGYWGRDRHEILLIGRRGDVAAPLPGSQPETVFRERKGKHSAKPDFYAETIERLFPGVARLEMFCRSPRPGWDHWGFEIGDMPETASEKVGGVASACSAFVTRRELDAILPTRQGAEMERGIDRCVTAGETATNPVAKASEDNGGISAIEGAPMTGEVSRADAGRSASATSERMDATAGETAPFERPSVTTEELTEFKLLGAIAGGISVSGPLFEALKEQGRLIWAGKELTVGGAKRLAELGRLVDAASDGDAVNVVSATKRGFRDALADWTEFNRLNARDIDDLSPDEIARRDALKPLVEADLAPIADDAPPPNKRGRKAVPA